MRLIYSSALGWAVLLGWAGLASAQTVPATREMGGRGGVDVGGWVVSQLDGTVRQWEVQGVDAGAGIVARDGTKIGTDAWLRMEREGLQRAKPNGLILMLRDGQQFPGEPVTGGTGAAAAGGEVMAWRHPRLGVLRVPLKEMLRVERFGTGVPPGGVSLGGGASGETSDAAVLLNGDVIRGVVSEVTGEGVVVLPASGEGQTVPWRSLRVLSLADVGGAGLAVAKPTYRVELVDGTVLRSAGFELNGAEVILQAELAGGESAGGAVRLGAAEVVVVERAGFSAWPLTLLVPVGVEHVPFLTAVRKPRFDASTEGGELKWGDRVVRRGIGMTAKTRVSYAVPEGFGVLRMGYQMDPSAEGGAGRGAAVVRVLSGEDVLFEAGKTEALTTEPKLATVDLKGAKVVTLEVDFGASAGVLARVNVLDPVLVKK